MKAHALLAALLLTGCTLEATEPKGTTQIGIVDETQDPGPEYVDESRPKSDPCSPQEVTIIDQAGERYVVSIPYLCDPRNDNGVRPPDFIEIPQAEHVTR